MTISLLTTGNHRDTIRASQRRTNAMYTHINFKTKKELKEAVGSGRRVTFFQPGPFGGNEPSTGTIYLEGPHYPAPHKWYAQAEAHDGRIVRVK